MASSIKDVFIFWPFSRLVLIAWGRLLLIFEWKSVCKLCRTHLLRFRKFRRKKNFSKSLVFRWCTDRITTISFLVKSVMPLILRYNVASFTPTALVMSLIDRPAEIIFSLNCFSSNTCFHLFSCVYASILHYFFLLVNTFTQVFLHFFMKHLQKCK